MSTQWTTLYKYVSLDRVPDILDNHRLYLSDGKNFNDPFEITVTDKKNHKIRHIEGLHILSLTNSFLVKSQIYIWVQISIKNGTDIQQKIMEACKQNKVKVTQMVLSDSDYSIKVKR